MWLWNVPFEKYSAIISGIKPRHGSWQLYRPLKWISFPESVSVRRTFRSLIFRPYRFTRRVQARFSGYFWRAYRPNVARERTRCDTDAKVCVKRPAEWLNRAFGISIFMRDTMFQESFAAACKTLPTVSRSFSSTSSKHSQWRAMILDRVTLWNSGNILLAKSLEDLEAWKKNSLNRLAD